MKIISFILLLTTTSFVFAQLDGSSTDTHIMGSGSKNATGPGVSQDSNKYKNQAERELKRKHKGKRAPYTDVIEGKTSIKGQ